VSDFNETWCKTTIRVLSKKTVEIQALFEPIESSKKARKDNTGKRKFYNLQKVAFLRKVEILKIDQNALCIMKREKNISDFVLQLHFTDMSVTSEHCV